MAGRRCFSPHSILPGQVLLSPGRNGLDYAPTPPYRSDPCYTQLLAARLILFPPSAGRLPPKEHGFLYLPQKAFRGEIAQGGDDGGSAVPSFCSNRVSLLQEDCEGRLFTCMFTKNCSKPAPVHICQHLSGCAQVMDLLQHRAPHLHFPSPCIFRISTLV